jgi:uridylate kinase
MEKGSAKTIYQRVLLKLSGEALESDHSQGIDANRLSLIAEQVESIVKMGVQVALVIGAGNIIRGAELCATGFDRISADQMGMLGTVINGLALRDAFEKKAIPVTLMSAFGITGIVDQYDRYKAKKALQDHKVVIFSGGTGNPLVTTDSAAALRGIEIGADALLKATKVDGVFDADPVKNPQAKRYQNLTFNEVIEKRLGVMDLNAILMCQSYKLPLRVFNMNEKDAVKNILLGQDVGTVIHE